MNQVLIVGAGASFGTLGKKAPIARDFGNYLHENLPKWTDDYPFLCAAIQYFEKRVAGVSLESWALDKVWSAIDNQVKLRHIVNPKLQMDTATHLDPTERTRGISLDPFGRAGIDLRSVLTRVYGEDLESEIARVVRLDGTLKDKLRQLSIDDCVVSFNYDLLVERLMEELGKRYMHSTTSSMDAAKRGSILLCKPHGSLSWKTLVPESGRRTEILAKTLSEKEIGRRQGETQTTQPGIIAPVPFKEQIAIPELQSDVPDFFNLLVAQWKDMIDEVSKASSLTFMGYRFPAEDLHAQYILGDAAARRDDARIEIDVFLKSMESYHEVEKSLNAIFKNATIEYKGRVSVS